MVARDNIILSLLNDSVRTSKCVCVIKNNRSNAQSSVVFGFFRSRALYAGEMLTSSSAVFCFVHLQSKHSSSIIFPHLFLAFQNNMKAQGRLITGVRRYIITDKGCEKSWKLLQYNEIWPWECSQSHTLGFRLYVCPEEWKKFFWSLWGTSCPKGGLLAISTRYTNLYV